MNDTYDEFTNLGDIPKQDGTEVYENSSSSQPHQHQRQHQQMVPHDLSEEFGLSKDSPDVSMLPPSVVSMSKEEIVIDNGRICPYCHKEFTSKGSLGRHLDSKKGDPVHPLDEITAIRSLTKRRIVEVPRGSRKAAQPAPPSEGTSKKRKVIKKSMARSQISVDPASGQREKSKLRRKLRDRRIKAKLLTNEWLLDQFGNYPLVEPKPTDPGSKFAHITALYLPVSKWPDSYPDNSSYDLVVNELKTRDRLDLLSILTIAFHTFEQLPLQHKVDIWRRETLRCLRPTIGSFSIADLHELKAVTSKKEQGHFEEICSRDNLSSYVDLDDGREPLPVEEEEEAEEEGIDQVKDEPEIFMAHLTDTPGSMIDEFTMFRE
ncbi:uncharacterized protein SPAPADRAFT_63972 [Spathaspora passalidarum NRRL Y-27907]|uniref:C2H2-type domain-containing protein n=1 Tax=Spathaspora passalidarum (strain NRRL Y-27907 / 11-Y1) TaxID=619300 RepID=G3AEH8_SPAPN|nr:uncharacterized protein SPAPADRAFT_63972 [Spathaspora passalidarum NRRL Y-27907]EGW34740.1 hypothetical protein SPAPADRAFT_63972 [Spathaspora passalidarum NRRL Y-27907]